MAASFEEAAKGTAKEQDERRGYHTFVSGFCGPESLFRQRVHDIVSGGSHAEVARTDLEKGLAHDQKFEEKDRVPYRDDTIGPRWAALSAIARAVMLGLKTKDGHTQLRIAVTEFEKVDVMFPLSYSAARSKPSSLELFKDLGSALEPWSPACWMVWDALAQLHEAESVATEWTWMLFAPEDPNGDGLTFRFVVEAVKGPDGLVVPDWWKLGLLPLPRNAKEGPAIPAIQEAMSWVAASHSGYRLRWHLKPPDTIGWWSGLSGRSGMAAAAVAARGVFQRIEEHCSDKESVLDDKSAVTAEIDSAGTEEVDGRELRIVDGLPAKFTAARKVGIDSVFVAAGQEYPPNSEGSLCVQPVKTVGEAYERLQSIEGVFDNYRNQKPDQFCYIDPPST